MVDRPQTTHLDESPVNRSMGDSIPARPLPTPEETNTKNKSEGDNDGQMGQRADAEGS